MKDKKYVITITRQFGSLGRPIAKLMAEQLGIEYYDRDIVDQAAKQLKLPASVVDEEEESAKKIFKNPFSRMVLPLGGGTNSTQDDIFDTQQNIIRFLAEKSSCVIVGRCSDYILKDEDVDLTNVFIYAPLEARIKRTMERDKVNEAQALALIKKNDKQRKCYYDFYTDRKWSSHINYDLTINSETFGINGTTDIIYNAVINR